MLILADILAGLPGLPRPPIAGLGAVHHVGVKVPDLDALAPRLAPLGLRCVAVADHPEVGLRVAFVEGGAAPLELLAVIGGDCPLRGDEDGLHHVAYRAHGLRDLVARLQGDSRFAFIGAVRVGGHGRAIATFRLRGGPAFAYELVDCGGEPEGNDHR
jgi:hypothetical protein